eukprot:GSChrysophyteH2.ASY1.ANO1.924.1 assembled CDS
MPQITRDLLRKRAEHNEGMVSTLEEVTLHQEEIESINEVIGMTCRKLKILYLQNNIIPKIENLFHCKELEYVNLALNNISKIEGLQNCEALKKLDLTMNFIDLDELKESMEHLQLRDRLRDLYMMGNPSEANWAGFKTYVVGKLPQLTNLDGTDITRSMILKAQQELPLLEKELRGLAKAVRSGKAQKAREAAELAAGKKRAKQEARVVELDDNDNEIVVEDANEMTENTPEVREKIYKELAQQKKEKADREKENMPKERDYEKEQAAAVAEIRKKEEESGEREIKQKNEAGLQFEWDEESKPGMLVLSIPVPRHLDSSLIDVDVHPTYVSVIIKGKTLRLRTLCEVKADDSKCQRAKTDGKLMVIMPKVNPKENVLTSNIRREDATLNSKINPLGGNGRTRQKPASQNRPKKLSMQEQMIADAMAAAAGGTTATKATATEAVDTGKTAKDPDSSLLNVGSVTSDVPDVRNIVRKKRDKPNELVKEEIKPTVFNSKVSLIEQIDD